MKKEKSFNRSLIFITAIPILLLGIIISISSCFKVQDEIYDEVQVELTNLVQVVANDYDKIYPGDFSLVENGDKKDLYKGEVCISNYSQYLDNFKDTTQLDISVFYGDTRYSTTIKKNDGSRATGTTIRSFVRGKVIDQGKIQFYKKVYIDDKGYFAVYAPMKNINGDIVAMLAIAKPIDKVNDAVKNVVYPIIIVDVVVLVLSMFVVLLYFRYVGRIVKSIKVFLQGVASGKLTEKLPVEVKKRNDEFGEIGRAAVEMQSSLRKLLETDGLTELYNRGYGEKRLKEMIESSSKQEKLFSVALGDIDFFKKVNDTYGHEAGDEVLREVSAILRKNMAGNGYAIRWGGEEFLLVFKGKNLEESLIVLKTITDEVKNTVVYAEEKAIRITMTFGVTQGIYYEDSDKLVKRADELLYYGKENGRDKICY